MLLLFYLPFALAGCTGCRIDSRLGVMQLLTRLTALPCKLSDKRTRDTAISTFHAFPLPFLSGLGLRVACTHLDEQRGLRQSPCVVDSHGFKPRTIVSS